MKMALLALVLGTLGCGVAAFASGKPSATAIQRSGHP